MIALAPNAHIVILTGAGISKESGLDTFRCDGGIWRRYNLEDVATPGGFARDPALVHAFYNDRRKQLLNQEIKPNAAHIALSELQRKWCGRISLVTQNIDNLHERAGSRDVIHMHGELSRLKCTCCTHGYESFGESTTGTACPNCQTVGQVRPDIVWFEEMPYHMDDIYMRLQDADLFVAIGTSGTVYPAAGFAGIARQSGAVSIEINLESTGPPYYFNRGYYGPATEQVPKFVKDVLTHGVIPDDE